MWYAVVILLLYLAVSTMAYRFRHPEQTETQLFLHILDAICWQ